MDEQLRRQDAQAPAIAAMLRRHLAQLRIGPEVLPQGTSDLTSGFHRRLEAHTLRCAVCIQVNGVPSLA